MYGTVALCHVRPDNLERLQALATAEDYLRIEGYVARTPSTTAPC